MIERRCSLHRQTATRKGKDYRCPSGRSVPNHMAPNNLPWSAGRALFCGRDRSRRWTQRRCLLTRCVSRLNLTMKVCLSITLLFGFSIVLWRILYPFSPWSALSLIPTLVFVFLGTFRNALDRRRSLIISTVRTDSSLLGLFTGRLIPALAVILISALSLSTLAVHTLLATPIQIAALLAIVAVSALVYSSLVGTCKPHIRPLALSWFSAGTAIFLVSTLFVAPYAFFEWSVVERPGFIRMEFDEAMSKALGQLPLRADILNQAVSVFLLVDSTKLWLATRFNGILTAGLLFAAHSALICIAASTCSVGAASFYRHYIEPPASRQPERAKDIENE